MYVEVEKKWTDSYDIFIIVKFVIGIGPFFFFFYNLRHNLCFLYLEIFHFDRAIGPLNKIKHSCMLK